VISRKAPYGYRRIPRGPGGPVHLEIFEPEAAVARRIFAAVDRDSLEAAAQVSYDNGNKWSPRRAYPGAGLLRGLVKCGPCGVATSAPPDTLTEASPY
jgi:hypothetical protein